MENQKKTTYKTKALILAELWLNYRTDQYFVNFVECNDLGLPLAYAVANEIVEVNPTVTKFIEETFDLLLEELDIEEDTCFETLDDMLALAE